jgi:hypothetical protein
MGAFSCINNLKSFNYMKTYRQFMEQPVVNSAQQARSDELAAAAQEKEIKKDEYDKKKLEKRVDDIETRIGVFKI